MALLNGTGLVTLLNSISCKRGNRGLSIIDLRKGTPGQSLLTRFEDKRCNQTNVDWHKSTQSEATMNVTAVCTQITLLNY